MPHCEKWKPVKLICYSPRKLPILGFLSLFNFSQIIPIENHLTLKTIFKGAYTHLDIHCIDSSERVSQASFFCN